MRNWVELTLEPIVNVGVGEGVEEIDERDEEDEESFSWRTPFKSAARTFAPSRRAVKVSAVLSINFR